jgi:hypothetical protein
MGYDVAPMMAAEWVSTLVDLGIVPMLKQRGYVLSVSPDRLKHCLLISFFKHQIHYYSSTISSYLCPCAKSQLYFDDDYEFFVSRQCPPAVWRRLRTIFEIEWFADGEAYADLIWIDLPNIVFSHIDVDASPATNALIDLLRNLDEEDVEEQSDAHLNE